MSIELRNLTPDDEAVIGHWPPYPPEFEELDYALRSDGWLSEYGSKPDTWIFAAEQSGDLIAFTILSKTGKDEAEFRIALRADSLGRGLGMPITSMTIEKGFSELGLSRIKLIVRENNPRAIRLYQRLGFVERGECVKEVNRKPVRFRIMELAKDPASRQR